MRNMNLFSCSFPCSPRGTLPVRKEFCFSGELHFDLISRSEGENLNASLIVSGRQQNYLACLRNGNIQVITRRTSREDSYHHDHHSDIVPVLPLKDAEEDQSVANAASGPFCAVVVVGDQHGHAVEWCLNPPRAG